MPIYDYRCTACGNEVEVVHGIHAEGPTTCTVCGGQMRKALSPPAIHFRGGGWAKKDARAASSAKAPDATKAGKDAASGEGSAADAGKAATTSGTGDSSSSSTASGGDGAASGAKGATSTSSPT